MATTAPVPVTGLSALGAALADAGADYLGRTRQLQDEERRRGQQLQDVRETRAYNEKVRADDRAARLEDETAMQAIRQGAALRSALVTEGLLNPADMDKPDLVSAAWQEMQRRGLDRLYQDLLSTPGPDGRPLLTQEDLAIPAKVAAAKDALGALKAKQLQFSMGQQENAQATVNDLQSQLAQVRQRSQQVAGAIDTPPQQYSPSSPEVMQLAAQLAEQAQPGGGRNREAIATMAPVAQKQLNEQALIQHAQRVQSATRELESLRYNEAQLTNALREAMQTFKVAPSPGSGAAILQAPLTSGPSAPKAASAEQMAAAMDAVFGKPAPAGGAASGAPAAAAILENPTNNPAIAAGNAEIQQRQQRQAQAMLNMAIEEGQRIESELASAGSATIPSLGVGLGGYSAMRVPDPVGGAKQASTLLQKKATNDAKIESLRAQLQGPSAAVTPPAVLTATFSQPTAGQVPEWWRGGGAVPASGM